MRQWPAALTSVRDSTAAMGSSSSTANVADSKLVSKFDKLSLNTSNDGPGFPEPKRFTKEELPMPLRPPPVTMPVPEVYNPTSRTMKHALAASHPGPLNTGDPLAGLSPPEPLRIYKPHSDQAVRRSERLSPPSSPPIPRAHSAPISPSLSLRVEEDDDPERCHSLTKQRGNPRCKNRRTKSARVPLEEFQSESQPIFYCGVHLPQQIRKKGFPSPRSVELIKKSNRENDGFVQYSNWIPDYLTQTTRVALMQKMNEMAGISEEEGYIYVFEIRDPNEPDLISLKVGRTTNLLKRLQSWEKQCSSSTQVFRYYWPNTGRIEDDLIKHQRSSFKPGPPGPHIHRLERLLHLHLADLVMYAQYNDPRFPNMSSPDDIPKSANSSKSPKSKPMYNQLALRAVQRQSNKCSDCGKFHKEIFPFIRTSNGPFEGQELEKIVIPIIQKWGDFVFDYV